MLPEDLLSELCTSLKEEAFEWVITGPHCYWQCMLLALETQEDRQGRLGTTAGLCWARSRGRRGGTQKFVIRIKGCVVLVAQPCLTLQSRGLPSTRLLCPRNSPGKNTPGVGSHSLLLGIFQSQGSNPGLLHYTDILHHLSHQGSQSGLRSWLKSQVTVETREPHGSHEKAGPRNQPDCLDRSQRVAWTRPQAPGCPTGGGAKPTIHKHSEKNSPQEVG